MKAAEKFDVRARRMFNGMGIYTEEKMFAFLIGDDVGLKLAPDDLQQALLLAGAELLRTEPTAEPMKEYVRMPREILDQADDFMIWLERSAIYAQQKRMS